MKQVVGEFVTSIRKRAGVALPFPDFKLGAAAQRAQNRRWCVEVYLGFTLAYTWKRRLHYGDIECLVLVPVASCGRGHAAHVGALYGRLTKIVCAAPVKMASCWCREIMDTMFKPENYPPVYFAAFLYVFSITMPHSISVNLAFGDNVLKNGASRSHDCCMMFTSYCAVRLLTWGDHMGKKSSLIERSAWRYCYPSIRYISSTGTERNSQKL